MNAVCRICSNADSNVIHHVREMAFGLRESFRYLECGSCGCLQLLDIPADLARYYPPTYYSFQEHGTVKTFLRRRWASHAYGKPNLLGKTLETVFFQNTAMMAVRRSGAGIRDRILDVGCGSGRLLLDLAYLGFTDLTGADPFISHDLTYPEGVKVFKAQLSQMKGPFDLIMLHHSYEHMDAPEAVMLDLRSLLTAKGQVLLRIPVASSYAWRHYGVHWINLDAPRHLFLHTFKSIEMLGSKAGLKVASIIHEGNDEQFWGSEQFSNDIPTNDPRSIGSSIFNRLKSWPRIKECRRKAEQLNRDGQADLVCFVLKPANR